MKFPRGAIAILLCGTLGFPAPAVLAQEESADAPAPNPATTQRAKHRQEYVSSQLQGDARILHALDRFTFGPRPGDLEAVHQIGLENWFNLQLQPAGIDESDLNARLAQYPAMQWSTQDLMLRMPGPAVIRQAMDGKVEIPREGTLRAVYQNQIYRLQMRKAAQAEKQAAAPARAAAGPAMSAPSVNPPANSSMNAMAQPSTAEPGAMNASAPAASGQASDAAPAKPAPDDAAIASILALEPRQRVLRLQNMPPEEFEGFIKGLKPGQRVALRNGLTPDLRESLDDLEAPEQTVVQELFAERLARDIYSNAQLEEVMTDFWLNHFNIYLRKNEQMPYYLVDYERDTIRPHALGKFEDLLEAVAHSPAMMIYLDIAQSIGPGSIAAQRAAVANARRPNAKKQAPEGLNENYARELMELHTVGVNGGYTQADVIQVARVLTGWGVDRPQFGGGFQFNENRHEPGTKKVMGAKIKEKGEMEGRELLHFLATRPATAQFISRKLAIRFVSDDPPQPLVDRMAKSYLQSGGDIPTLLKTLSHSPEFWAASDNHAKIKTPLEYVVSAVRASNADVENYQPLVNQLRQMGMPLYGCIPPVGYKWDEADWVSTGALVDRMNFALALAANKLPGITVEWAPEMDMSALDGDAPAQQVIPTPKTEESRLEPMLLPGGASDATRAAALEEFEKLNTAHPSQAANAKPAAPARPNRASAADVYEREDQLLAGLLIGSPEFQRR